jgi:hypothetical protein
MHPMAHRKTMHPMAHSCGNYNNFVNVIIASSELNFKGKGSSEIKSTHCLRTHEHTSPGEPIGIYKELKTPPLPLLNFALPSLN